MDKKINLSQFKEKVNGNVVITIILIILAIVLGYACWFTFEQGVELEAKVASEIVNYNDNRILLKNLKDLQANSNYYIAQKEKYDEVIAENGTYNEVDYYIELTELCEAYELAVQEITVGEMSSNGYAQELTSTVTVVGNELNVKNMAQYIVSQKEIARIDTITMTEQEDGTVVASMVIVNFTK